MRERLGLVRATVTGALLCAVTGGAVACGSTEPGSKGPGSAEGTLQVVAGFYPLQFIAQQAGGDRVRVENLSRPGAEPHDVELSPRQVAGIADADLVVYLAGFQPAVDQAVEQTGRDAAFDVSAVAPLITAAPPEHEPEGAGEGRSGDGVKDPHVWLDPTRLATIADALAQRLAAIDTDGAAGYRDRAQELGTRLTALDGEYAQGLATCQRREIVTSHTAFGYLADRYKLEQIGISGLAPEVEPTPQRLAQVTAEARRHGATTIFFETLVSPRVAEAIAEEVGATTAVLDPLEGLAVGAAGDYFSVMRDNLSTLRAALGCA